MRIFVFPLISVVMSLFYYMPWLLEPARDYVPPYLLAFFWFMGAWLAAIYYGVRAFKLRKIDSSQKNRYISGMAIILVSYVIVWVGIFNGYLLTV